MPGQLTIRYGMAILSAMISCAVYSQEAAVMLDFSEYFEQRQKVDSLVALKKYPNAANAFSRAFAINNQSYPTGDRYMAAKVWALAGNNDSALYNLSVEIRNGFSDYEKLIAEKAFRKIKKEKKWNNLVILVKDRQEKENAKTGKYRLIKTKLEQILEADQKYRGAYIASNHDQDSTAYKAILKIVEKTDKQNLKYVRKIIDTYGWLSHDTIGVKASRALFLVIQHADSASQEKYLPVMRQAVQEHKANAYDLALLEDRVLINRGEKQLYGTQYTCDDKGKNCRVLPIADEKNVDRRRSAMGMEPLEAYLKVSGIKYVLPAD